jgi:hypothetical protein
MPALASTRGCGHPKVSSDRLFLKAGVLMIVRHLHTVHELLSVLAQPIPEMLPLRQLLTERERFPSRRSWERQMSAMPASLPAQIGCLGRHLLDLIEPWAASGRAVAIDRPVLGACGGVWHQKHREQGGCLTPRLIPKPDFPKSGWQCFRLWLEAACRFRRCRHLVSCRSCADCGHCRRQ